MKRLRLLLLLLLIPFALAQTATEVEITAEPAHHIALENEMVRVFKVEVAPKGSTLMHRHRHDYFSVALGETHISNEVEGKQPAEVRLNDGDTRFTSGNFAHVARDLADTPFRNVMIELLQDEKLRLAPSRWPGESGDQTFQGGRIKVLFVKDGLRASEVNLEPGAVVPSHHHDGPHLVVAVSDLNLRSNIEGARSASELSLKAGDIQWVPGGYSHTVTNTGKSAARLITFEF
jgi:quercetin dioxygenase-like cupin family protein